MNNNQDVTARKAAALKKWIDEHISHHHINGGCGAPSGGCCPAEMAFSDLVRLREIARGIVQDSDEDFLAKIDREYIPPIGVRGQVPRKQGLKQTTGCIAIGYPFVVALGFAAIDYHLSLCFK